MQEGRYAPPVHMINLTASQEITPYQWVHPHEDRRRPRYWGWPVFGRAASSERFAIHASYSGVPRRGGVPSGRPPIHDGMSAICSPAVLPPAQPDSNRLCSNSIIAVRIAFRDVMLHECRMIAAKALRCAPCKSLG